MKDSDTYPLFRRQSLALRQSLPVEVDVVVVLPRPVHMLYPLFWRQSLALRQNLSVEVAVVVVLPRPLHNSSMCILSQNRAFLIPSIFHAKVILQTPLTTSFASLL